MVLNAETFKKQIAEWSKGMPFEEVQKWNSSTWAHLCAVTAGFNPFESPATDIIPGVYKAFASKGEGWKPSSKERSLAQLCLIHALNHINSAVIYGAQMAFENIFQLADATVASLISTALPQNFDVVAQELQRDLFDYDKRKMYFQAGLPMMGEDDAWLSRHHIFAVAIVATYQGNPKAVMPKDLWHAYAADVGLLVDGKVNYNPIAKDKKQTVAPDELYSRFTDMLSGQVSQEAEKQPEEKPAVKSKKEIFDELRQNLKKKP